MVSSLGGKKIIGDKTGYFIEDKGWSLTLHAQGYG